MIIFAAVAVLASAPARPAERWTKTVRPGITYIQEVSREAPLIFHALKFKFPAAGFRLESRIANDDVYGRDESSSRETVEQTARRTGAFAAVNADFFAWDGDPLGMMMTAGELVSEPYVPRSAAAWADGGLLFDSPRWSGSLMLIDGTSFAIDGVNRSARDNEIIVNTRKAGVASSKQPCYAFVFEPTMPVALGQITPVKLKNIFPEAYNLPVGENQIIVMVTSSRYKPMAGQFHVGLVYDMRVVVTGQIDWKSMKEAVGGGPRLVKGGQPYITNLYEKFDAGYSKRHPRTAVGYTSYGETIICVVEGRSSLSRGVTLDELASLMIKLGCADAMNLDGGGSSTMYLGGVVVNRLSDGAARRVASSLLLYAPPAAAPSTQISIVAKPGGVRPGDQTTMKLIDSVGAAIPDQEVVWSCTSGAGWIDAGGTFRALSSGTARVKAIARGAEASVDIRISE
ncbi:MAG: phosphodiester glycosidase family protein [Armatimonadetes bacterium]|nr:phosphodiester glycosidase family protein [Armatimonadota bacterium]